MTMRPMRPTRSALHAALAALALAGCVTRDLEADGTFDALVDAGPVIIPLGEAGDAGGGPLDDYYRSIVAQLQESVVERNPDRVDALLATHDRTVAPDWAADAMASFRRLSAVLRSEAWCEEHAEIVMRSAPPALGEAVPLALRIPPGGAAGVSFPGLGERIAPARFSIGVRFVDRDCRGSRSESGAQDLLALAATVELAAVGLDLPFDVPAIPPSGCERELVVTCELLPGARLLDGEAVPGQRSLLASARFALHPRGIERVHAAPLATLRAAIASRDPRHFDHVWLASRAMPAADRLAADEALIGALRLGPPDLAVVAAACLREASGAPIAPSDRDGWLAWWHARRRVETADAPRAERR